MKYFENETKSIDTELLDERCEQFHTDPDVADALDSWVRGHYSDKDILERLQFLKQEAQRRAEEKILGPSEPDDEYANPGTWGAA